MLVIRDGEAVNLVPKNKRFKMVDKQKLVWLYIRGCSIEYIARKVLRRPEDETKAVLRKIMKGETKLKVHWGDCMQSAKKWSHREVVVLRRLRRYKADMKLCRKILARRPKSMKKKWAQIKRK